MGSEDEDELSMMMKLNNGLRKRVISLDVDLMSYCDSLNRIIAIAKRRVPGYVCFANVHMTIEAYLDKTFAERVNEATLVLPDGVPLVKTIKLLYGITQDRVAGMDVMPEIIKIARKNQLKILFFGTTSEILEKIRKRISEESPQVDIVGLISPPFDKSLDDQFYIDAINQSQANLVFVALGCPKQEKWMATHSKNINALLLGVGGAFPVYAGIVRRAPLLMRNSGLEWLYRLLQDPRRLFMRYFKTNTLFLYLVFKVKMKKILFHR